MTRPKISKFLAELMWRRSCGGRKHVVMGRFKYKFRGGKIYRADNVGFWGRLWERVEVDE